MVTIDDPYDLERFVVAQAAGGSYSIPVAEWDAMMPSSRADQAPLGGIGEIG